MNNHIIAHTATLDTIIATMQRHDLSENTPARFAPVYCASNDGRRADIWADGRVALCGKCYLEWIEATQ